MSDIKQLLEKATRKTEMRWRVLAFDPEQDNKLVHTSKNTFDCIKMAGEYKMDLAKKNPNYIIEIIAESKEKKKIDTKVFDIDFSKPDATSKLQKFKQEGISAFENFLNKSNSNSYLSYTIKRTNSKYPNDYVIYVDILYDFGLYENQYKLEVAEAWSRSNTTTSIMKKIAKKPDTIKQSVSIAFDKAVKDAMNLIKTNESFQKNEAYSEQYKTAWNNLKVGDTVRVTDFNYQFSKNMKVARIYSNGTNKVVEFDFTLPSGKKYTKPLARIYKDSEGYKTESSQKNEANDYIEAWDAFEHIGVNVSDLLRIFEFLFVDEFSLQRVKVTEVDKIDNRGCFMQANKSKGTIDFYQNGKLIYSYKTRFNNNKIFKADTSIRSLSRIDKEAMNIGLDYVMNPYGSRSDKCEAYMKKNKINPNIKYIPNNDVKAADYPSLKYDKNRQEFICIMQGGGWVYKIPLKDFHRQCKPQTDKDKSRALFISAQD